jgi:hypothetical protein
MARVRSKTPAFPGVEFHDCSPVDSFPGMTIREYYAGQALSGLTSSRELDGRFLTPSEAAVLSYAYADQMLIERETPPFKGAKMNDAERFFDAAWDRLSILGKCDDRGGQEYQRVKEEWLASQRPADIWAFILDRANIGPDDVFDPQIVPSDNGIDDEEVGP